MPININELNIDITFKVAQANFLRLDKITYIVNEFKIDSFSTIKIIRSNIFFSEKNQYTILCLQQSKTDNENTGIQIVLAITEEKICLVTVLSRLYTLDLQLANALLFHFSSCAFSRFSIVTAPKKGILLVGLKQANYFGYSFYKGIA